MKLNISVLYSAEVIDKYPCVIFLANRFLPDEAAPSTISLLSENSAAALKLDGEAMKITIPVVGELEPVYVLSIFENWAVFHWAAISRLKILVVEELEMGLFVVVPFQPSAEEGNCCPAPCCHRSPQRRVSQVHNSILSQMKNAAAATAAWTQES